MSQYIIVIAEDPLTHGDWRSQCSPEVVGPFADQGLAETWLLEHDDTRLSPRLRIYIVPLIVPDRYGA